MRLRVKRKKAPYRKEGSSMTAQDHIALVGILYDTYTRHQSDPQRLDQSLASYPPDCEVLSVPLGVVLHGLECLKQFSFGWGMAFPDSQVGPAVRKKQHSRKVDKCGTV
jgi:hypothetical protein